jgi:hypothetical protein
MSKVIIPEKHYVGMVVRNGSKIPLGFITPWGDDKAAQKRMKTVDDWASAGKQGSLPTSIIDNIPMLGFKMTSDIRRGQQGAQDKWRIEDPRGFELEITSTNLAMILADSTIEKGEILDQCVWARDGGQNLLLTVVSEEYIEAVRMTQIASSSASWKDVKIGNTVVLQNGLEGQYLGKMHTIRKNHRSRDAEVQNSIEPSSSSYHVILKPTTDRSWPQGVVRELHFISSPKLSGISDTTEITAAEAEIIANENIADPTCVIDSSGYGYRNVVLAAANPIKDGTWTISLASAKDGVDVWKHRHYGNEYLVRIKDGRLGWPWTDYQGNHKVILIREDLLPKGIVDDVMERHSFNRGHWGSSTSSWVSKVVDVNPTDVVSVHTLRISIETKAGNTIENIV